MSTHPREKVATTLPNSNSQGYSRITSSTASNQTNALYRVSSRTEHTTVTPSVISTKSHENIENIYLQIGSAFWKAKREAFEDGMESKFSQDLISLVKKYSQDAIEAITCLIVYEKVNPEVSGEALRWLGRMEHPESYLFRRWLLERSLTLSSARVKDGAILGLASMDDKHAIKYLQEAIKKEQCDELKIDIKQVLEQLES